MYTSGAMLFLYQETNSHVGAGEGDAVDLAIQRDETTKWPIYHGASLKGSLRHTALRKLGVKANDESIGERQIRTVFGAHPGPGSAESGAGAMADIEAQILAFPVASLAGVNAWVTCPAAIGLFRRRWRLIGASASAIPRLVNWVRIDLALLQAIRPPAGASLIVGTDKIVLEDIVFNASEDAVWGEIAADLAMCALPDFEPIRTSFAANLLLVHDSIFSDLLRNSVPIETRVTLDDDTGTVKQGPWDEEVLPRDTLLYAPLLAEDPPYPAIDLKNDKNNVTTASEVLSWMTSVILPGEGRIRIGGDQSVGRGMVSTRFAGFATQAGATQGARQ